MSRSFTSPSFANPSYTLIEHASTTESVCDDNLAQKPFNKHLAVDKAEMTHHLRKTYFLRISVFGSNFCSVCIEANSDKQISLKSDKC